VPKHPALAREAQLRQSVFAGLLGKLARRSGPTYPLHIGDACFAPGADWQAAAPASPSLGRYGNPAGDPALVDALLAKVAASNGMTSISAERLQITIGATHALWCAARAVLGPGDEVLLLAPYWPLIRGIATLTGATPVEVPFYDRLATNANVADLLSPHLGARTAAIYLTNPNNPDGTVLGRQGLEGIAAFARAHDLWVFADECYEHHVYEGEHTSIGALPGLEDRVFTAWSFSKSHALAGLRLGYLAGPGEAMVQVRRISNHTVYNAPAGAQAVALAALGRGQQFLDEQRARARAARDAVVTRLRLPHRVPIGGAYVFVDLSDVLRDRPLDLFLDACVERGLLLAPGEAFGSAYARWARVCFTACPEEQLADALAILDDVVARF
jgi:aspartate/methionine/tyrosine aminotransferase